MIFPLGKTVNREMEAKCRGDDFLKKITKKKKNFENRKFGHFSTPKPILGSIGPRLWILGLQKNRQYEGRGGYY